MWTYIKVGVNIDIADETRILTFNSVSTSRVIGKWVFDA